MNMSEAYINIAYAPDDNYADITAVSIQSAIDNCAPLKPRIFILHSKLSNGNLDKFREIAKASGAELVLSEIDESEFHGLPISDWVTVQAWFRIKIPELFPELDKVLYLDCDTLVDGPLEALWNSPVDGLAVGVVRDIWNVDKYVSKLGMKSKDYFNSGMMLINCRYWRENNLSGKMLEYARGRNVEFCDQDTLNKVIDEHKLMLPMKFNYLEPWWRGCYHEYGGENLALYAEAKSNPVIIHFTGPKPNKKGCGHSMVERWWKYAKRTPIANELHAAFDASTPPKNKSGGVLKSLFSVGNEFADCKKQRVLRLLGMKFKLGDSKKSNP